VRGERVGRPLARDVVEHPAAVLAAAERLERELREALERLEQDLPPTGRATSAGRGEEP
jgi:hypothetical protein